jgi:hypothetical protein
MLHVTAKLEVMKFRFTVAICLCTAYVIVHCFQVSGSEICTFGRMLCLHVQIKRNALYSAGPAVKPISNSCHQKWKDFSPFRSYLKTEMEAPPKSKYCCQNM